MNFTSGAPALEIFEDLPCALAILDRDFRYLRVSGRWLEEFGLVGRNLNGASHFDFFPQLAAHWRDLLERALNGESRFIEEEIFRRPDGRAQWFEWRIQPWRLAEGEIGGVAIAARNIAKRKSAEIALTESETFLRSIVDANPVAIITIDETGAILTFSRAAELIFGYKESEIAGGNVNMLMTEPDRSRHHDYIARYLETGEARIIGRSRRIRALRKNGEAFPAILHISKFEDGKLTFVGFIQDLTDEAAVERRLSETQAQLQHAGRLGALGEMTTTIAHEINQPLTAAASLAGAASLILRKISAEPSEEARRLIDEAVSEIRRASDIIHQMRDFAKKRKTARSLHDVNKVVEDAGAVALIGAAGDGIDIEYRLRPDVGLANIDRIQIQQVVTNLIRNAVDAMNKSPVRRLTISTEKRNGRIEIAVADTGCGVAPEMKSRLFEPFVSDKEEGLGVGLSITKSIVDAHQGEILVNDNDAGGATFIVRLPVERG